MLVLVIPINLNELLEDCRPTSCAANRESRRVVEVTEDPAIVLVVAVLRSEDCWADRAGEVFNMELLAQRSNVAAPQCATAIGTEQVQSSEVVCLAQWKELCAVGCCG